MKPDPAAHVVDEVVDPGTRRVLLKFDDGTFEATRWPASRFNLASAVWWPDTRPAAGTEMIDDCVAPFWLHRRKS